MSFVQGQRKYRPRAFQAQRNQVTRFGVYAPLKHPSRVIMEHWHQGNDRIVGAGKHNDCDPFAGKRNKVAKKTRP